MRQFALQSHFDVFINVFGNTEETRKRYLRWVNHMFEEEEDAVVKMVMEKIRYQCGEPEPLKICFFESRQTGSQKE